jgi:hypothetical protein
MENNERVIVPIKCCADFDTQVITYLHRLFEKKSRDDKQGCYDMLKYVYQNKIDFTPLPFIFENSKKIGINYSLEDAYRGLVVYAKLLDFDYDMILNFPSCIPADSVEHLVRADSLIHNAKQFAESEIFDEYFRIQKIIQIMLMKITIIKFRSTGSIKNDFIEFMSFINERIGFVLEKEIAICYHFLRNDQNVSRFFKKIQKNNHNIIKNLLGMAWDLVHIRFIQINMCLNSDAIYPVEFHSLITFDYGLQDVLKIHPVKSLFYYEGRPLPIVQYKTPLKDIITEINYIDLYADGSKKRSQIRANMGYDYDEIIKDLSMELEKMIS